jgi:autotransporter passenger strand-loop-strand repeat protein
MPHSFTSTVSAGQTVLDLAISPGDTLILLSGATASATSLSGTEIVSSGGQDVGATVYNGGEQRVYGAATSDTLSSGGLLTVSRGGTASDTTVSSGGTMSVTAGGSALDTTIAAGGSEIALAQGSDTGALIAGMQIVRGTATSAEIMAGGTQSVSNGGVASDTLVEAGGTQSVAMGGTASNALVEMGGAQTVSKGGVTSNTSVESGGMQSVAVGGVASNTLVEAGGTQTISKGGVASNTIVGSGGTQSVANGGVANNTLVEAGGTENVLNGGITLGSVLSGASDLNPPSAGGLHIVFSYPHGGVPVAAQAALQIAAQFLENMFVFSTPVTVNISVDWGDIAGFPIPPGGLAAAKDAHRVRVSFDTLVNALHLSGAQLPASDPSNGAGFFIDTAEAKTLGLLPGNNAAIDGYIGFGNTVTWDYAQQGVVGTQDFIAGAEHEITHAMGRGIFSALDLFRYAAPGVLWNLGNSSAFSPTGYLSLDGGVTNLGNFQPRIFDAADTADANPDPFGIGTPGQAEPVTLTDIEEMDALFGGVPLNLAKENLSGGTAWNTVVSTGGLLTVGSGGVALGTTLLSGGFEAVSAGGRSLGATVSNDGQLDVYSGGNDINTTLSGTGSEMVYAGGVATGTTVTNGADVAELAPLTSNLIPPLPGQLFVYGTTVSALLTQESTATETLFGTEVVFSGGLASATTVSGGVLVVSHGGVASNTLVESGGATSGTDLVLGTEIGTTVLAGGFDRVFGNAIDTTVRAGGTLQVTGSGVVSGAVVSSGGTISAGAAHAVSGSVLGATIGGSLMLADGGNASGTMVSGGGQVDVSNGGKAIASVIDPAGTQTVSFGGIASGTIVSSGGTESVTAGGFSDGTTVLNGGQQIVADPSLSVLGPNLIQNGGFEAGHIPPLWSRSSLDIFLATPGTAGLQAHSGNYFAGMDSFYLGLDTLSQTISDTPGVQYTLSYWLAGDGQNPVQFDVYWNNELLVPSDTTEVAASGYERYTLTVTGTGNDTLEFDVSDFFGVLALDDVSLVSGTVGGLAVGTVVSSGGMQIVTDGGTASGTVVSSGGVQTVSSGHVGGGTASDTIVYSGGTQYVSSQSVASGTLVDGAQIVSCGGTTVATAVGANLIRNGGFETGDFTGWTLNASRGGALVGTEADFGVPAHTGNYFAVLGNFGSTGTLSQTISDTPGAQYTLSYWLAGDGQLPNSFETDWNGVALAGSIESNAAAFGYQQFVFTVTGTGHDTLTFVEEDDPGFWALDDVTLGSGTGGVENVLSGGVASSTTIIGGGSEIVAAGGMVNGATIAGGTLEVQPGATIGGTIAFTGSSSVLQIDGPGAPPQNVLPNATLSDSTGSGAIDLRGVTFQSGSTASANAAGTQLTVSVGGNTYLFAFDGSIAGHTFTVSSDNHGGSLVTDPPFPAGSGGSPASAGNVPSKMSDTIAPGATLEPPSAYSGKVTFLGSTGTLQLDDSASFAGTVAGMGGADAIDLRDIGAADAKLSTSGDSSSSTLSTTDGANSANITLLGNHMASAFATASDGHGGTLISEASTQTPLVTLPHA